jgi:hypothetical protein
MGAIIDSGDLVAREVVGIGKVSQFKNLMQRRKFSLRIL